MRRVFLALVATLALLVGEIIPCAADLPPLTRTGDPLTVGEAPYMVLSGLTGQSAGVIAINGTFGGSYAVEGLSQATQTWTPALTVVTTDGLSPETAITAAGSYAFNSASFIAVRVDATAGTGTPNVTLSAGGGVSRVLYNNSGSGGISAVAGTSPIQVTTTSGTATVSCPTCAVGTPLPISVRSGINIAVATPSPGVFVVNEIVTPAPAATAVSVQAGANVTVATPSPGVFVVAAVTAAPPAITASTGIAIATPSANTYVVSNTGVVALAGTANQIAASAATGSVTLSIPSSPVFAGTTTVGNLVDSGLPAGTCVGTTAGGQLTNGLAPFTSGGCQPNAITTSTATLPVVGGQFTLNITPDIAPYYGEMNYFANPSNTVNFIAQRVSASIGAGTGTFQVVQINVGTGGSTTIPVGTALWAGGIQYAFGSNLVMSAATTVPTVAVTQSPTFTGTVTVGALTITGSTNNRCLLTSSSDTFGVAALNCPFSTTSASFVIPAVGSTVNVSYVNSTVAAIAKEYTTVQITDGTNSMIGLVTGTPGNPTTITNEGMVAGAVGNTMATGAALIEGGGTGVPGPRYQNGTALNGMHIETGSASIATISTSLFSFGTTYSTAPICNASTTGASIAPGVTVVTGYPTTTQVELYNSSVGTVTGSFLCIGF